MKILNRKLTPIEREFFNQEPVDRWSIFIIYAFDIVMTFGACYLLIEYHDNSLFILGITTFYVVQLIVMILLIIGLHSYADNSSNISDDISTKLLRTSNSAIDWPFGVDALPFTIKNFITMNALIFASSIAEQPYLTVVVIALGLLSVICNYYKALVTRTILDMKLTGHL